METILKNTNEIKGRLECSKLYMTFICKILINRIIHGYSAEDLSFLLGKEDDFIERLEGFEIVDFGMELYGKLCPIFNHANFFLDSEQLKNENVYEKAKWRQDGYIYHRLDLLVNNHEAVPVFQVMEEEPRYKDRYSNSVRKDLLACQDMLCLMFEEGLFNKPLGPHFIQHHIAYTVQYTIPPRHLKVTLDKLWGRKGKAPLKRSTRRSYGYRYSLHPGVSSEQALEFAKQTFEENE